MTDRELRMLKNMDISKIDRTGRYVDVSVPIIFNLTLEQVEYLRAIYQTKEIAPDFRMPSHEPIRTARRRDYRVSRDQRYNDGRHRTKRPIKFPALGKIIVGALVITIAAGAYKLSSNVPIIGSGADVSNDVVVTTVVNKANNFSEYNDLPLIDEGDLEENIDSDVLDITSDVEDVKLDVNDNNNFEDSVQEDSPVEEINGDIIRELCNIYGVNYDVVYPFIRDLTDNFSSESYLNGKIEGITCKGQDVVARNEKELLIYIVRCVKQLPGRYGIDTRGLYSNDYQSGTDFEKQISKVCDDLGVDRCLMYAIAYSESNLKSDLFMNSNNPAGIKNGHGKWWVFDTKEEGFYELGMEILKYYRIIGESPTEVNSDIIRKIGNIHAPVSDGNDNWVPNVIANYQRAKMNEAVLFGDTENMTLINT